MLPKFRKSFTSLLACCVIFSLGSKCQHAHAESPTRKKLIEFGWDEPNQEYLRKNIRQMEEQPFDGCVFHLTYNRPNGLALPESEGTFVHEAWGKRRFTEDELSVALRDLKDTPFSKFKDNFVRLNVSPGNIDWFDDYSAVVSNIGLLAKVAAQGGVKGIFIDTEYYMFPLFAYSKQKYANKKSFAEYSSKVRSRGQEIMRSIERSSPNPIIFLSYSYTLPLRRNEFNLSKVQQDDYALLLPFLDGMLDAASSNVRFIDGYESAYRFKSAHEFKQATHEVKVLNLPYVENPAKYSSLFSIGFGLWLDAPQDSRDWSPIRFDKNYFSPEELENSLKLALAHTDEYVWIYNQRASWWRVAPGRIKMPKEYVAAVHSARKALIEPAP